MAGGHQAVPGRCYVGMLRDTPKAGIERRKWFLVLFPSIATVYKQHGAVTVVGLTDMADGPDCS